MDTQQLDARTLKSIATLDPKAQASFTRFALGAKAAAMEHGCDYIMISGNRSWKEQDALYAKGRTLPGKKVTNARGGYSNHNFGIAGDFGVFRHGAYLDETEPRTAERVHRACAVNAEACGLEWGGHWQNFQDLPHYEILTTLSMAQKHMRYAQSGSVL